MNKNIRIVFMGTPEFAVATLDAIHKHGYDIAGIITAPDKPAGRGNKIQMSAVKEYAIKKNIEPVLQPTNLKDPGFIKTLSELNADLFIVVAFRMLPEAIWAMPALGTINLHASLLPQYRGAAPINWAIINGEQQTGVSTFFIEKEIDTGHILLQEKIDILQDDNAGSLHDKLMLIGSRLVIRTVDNIKNGTHKHIPQLNLIGPIELKSAPKIFKDNCRIDWNKNAGEIQNFIRGLSPYPSAWTELIGIDGSVIPIKIFESVIVNIDNSEQKPGTVMYSNNEMNIRCKNGIIGITGLQQAGKSKMDCKSFLLGFKGQNNYTLVS